MTIQILSNRLEIVLPNNTSEALEADRNLKGGL